MKIRQINADEYQQIRERIGSQRFVAKQLGVDIRTVQRRELNEIKITLEAVRALFSLYAETDPLRTSSVVENRNDFRGTCDLPPRTETISRDAAGGLTGSPEPLSNTHKSPKPNTATAKVLELVAEGWSPKEAAEIAGVSTQAVYAGFRNYPHLRPNNINRPPYARHQSSPSPNEIAARIQAARAKLGLSRSGAAKAWGLDYGTLGAWETGYRNPAGLYLEKLEGVLKHIEAS